MTRRQTLGLAAGAVVAGFALVGARGPSLLAQAQPGLWQVSGVPGKGAIQQCIGDISQLARFEHRAARCSAHVLSDGGAEMTLDYSCGRAGFGHSEVELITPRSLRIATQGISGGLPFNYVLQARRVADCATKASVIRH